MAEIDNSLIFEVLKGIQADIARVSTRLDRLDERMALLERRQTASTHFEQSVLAHLAAIHDSIDGSRAEVRAMDRRLQAVEAR